MKLVEMKARLLQARKEKDTMAKAVLSCLIADIEYAERSGKEVDGAALIRKYIRIAEDNADKCPTVDGTAKYLDEVDFLETLLPKQLDVDEIREIIHAGNFTNIGQVMKHFKENYQGQYDGKAVSMIAKVNL